MQNYLFEIFHSPIWLFLNSIENLVFVMHYWSFFVGMLFSLGLYTIFKKELNIKKAFFFSFLGACFLKSVEFVEFTLNFSYGHFSHIFEIVFILIPIILFVQVLIKKFRSFSRIITMLITGSFAFTLFLFHIAVLNIPFYELIKENEIKMESAIKDQENFFIICKHNNWICLEKENITKNDYNKKFDRINYLIDFKDSYKKYNSNKRTYFSFFNGGDGFYVYHKMNVYQVSLNINYSLKKDRLIIDTANFTKLLKLFKISYFSLALFQIHIWLFGGILLIYFHEKRWKNKK